MCRQCLCWTRNGRNEKKPPTKIAAAVRCWWGSMGADNAWAPGGIRHHRTLLNCFIVSSASDPSQLPLTREGKDELHSWSLRAKPGVGASVAPHNSKLNANCRQSGRSWIFHLGWAEWKKNLPCMSLMVTFITYINYRLAELHTSNWTLAPAGSGDGRQLLISYDTN